MMSSRSSKSCPKTLSMASATNRSEFHVFIKTLAGAGIFLASCRDIQMRGNGSLTIHATC
jgi:hypothetical protein